MYLSIHPSVRPSIHESFIHPSIHLSTYSCIHVCIIHTMHLEDIMRIMLIAVVQDRYCTIMLSTFHSKGSWRLWFTSMIFCWRAQSTTSVATAWEVSLLFTSMKASHCAKCGVFGVACHDSTWLILIQYASDKFPIVQGWTWLMLIIFHHSSLVLEVWSHGFWSIPKGFSNSHLSISFYCEILWPWGVVTCRFKQLRCNTLPAPGEWFRWRRPDGAFLKCNNYWTAEPADPLAVRPWQTNLAPRLLP